MIPPKMDTHVFSISPKHQQFCILNSLDSVEKHITICSGWEENIRSVMPLFG